MVKQRAPKQFMASGSIQSIRTNLLKPLPHSGELFRPKLLHAHAAPRGPMPLRNADHLHDNDDVDDDALIRGSSSSSTGSSGAVAVCNASTQVKADS